MVLPLLSKSPPFQRTETAALQTQSLHRGFQKKDSAFQNQGLWCLIPQSCEAPSFPLGQSVGLTKERRRFSQRLTAVLENKTSIWTLILDNTAAPGLSLKNRGASPTLERFPGLPHHRTPGAGMMPGRARPREPVLHSALYIFQRRIYLDSSCLFPWKNAHACQGPEGRDRATWFHSPALSECAQPFS